MTSRVEFEKQIRQALENLHDYAYLQRLPITAAMSAAGQTLDQSVRQLRTELLAAIEQLNPTGSLPPRARERRPYALLYGRYVQGMSTAELVEELAISVRQLRREHQRAMAALIELMWGKLSPCLSAKPTPALPALLHPVPRQAIEQEAEQLVSQASPEDLMPVTVVEGVLSVLTPVASRHGITLRSRLPEALPSVRADRILLRQAMLELVSYAVRWMDQGEVTVYGATNGGAVTLRICASGLHQAEAEGPQVPLNVSRRLIAGLGGGLTTQEQTGHWQATIRLPAPGDPTILVMDDNQGLVELFRRYLAGRRYRVLQATTAEQAIWEARQTPPALIVLDIMMPEQDGWEVLQQLRAAPETKDRPIMICSVLDEPEIAANLGASDYLTKPVSQDALLTKVERWCDSSA